jgi:DNA-3-methyladenine glycosylase II
MQEQAPTVLVASRSPFNFKHAFAYFQRRAGELVDSTDGDSYRRLLLIEGSPCLIEACEGAEVNAPGLSVAMLSGDASKLPAAAAALRRTFGLDDDLAAFAAAVRDDVVLRGLLDRYRGLRLVRTQSAFEALIWAVIGQQINLTFAFRLKSTLVRMHGNSLDYDGRTYWSFPEPQTLAGADPIELAATGLGRRKAATIVNAAQRVASGDLNIEALGTLPRAEAEARLVDLPGIGPWTAQYTLLRGLGDFGAFPTTDLGLRVAIGKLYEQGGAASLPAMKEAANRWGEWRGYAAFYLWNALAERAA